MNLKIISHWAFQRKFHVKFTWFPLKSAGKLIQNIIMIEPHLSCMFVEHALNRVWIVEWGMNWIIFSIMISNVNLKKRFLIEILMCFCNKLVSKAIKLCHDLLMGVDSIVLSAFLCTRKGPQTNKIWLKLLNRENVCGRLSIGKQFSLIWFFICSLST